MIQKVRAHRNVAGISDPLERYLAIGNAIADCAAKRALDRHPADAPLCRAAWDLEWLAATTTAALIAKVGRLWPPARPPPKPRKAAADAAAQRTLQRRKKRASEASNVASHRWTTSRGITKCAYCGVVASSRRAKEGPCPGETSWKVQLAAQAAARGHRLHLATVIRPGEEPHGMLLCLACGACCEWGRTTALAGPCRPGASRKLGEQLARMKRGLFPRSGAANRGVRLALVGPLET